MESTVLGNWAVDLLRDGVEAFVQATVLGYVELGGSLVTEANAADRINVCHTLQNGQPCPYAGRVRPLPKLPTLAGCTLCGCPFTTKPHAKEYFSITAQTVVQATCPHPAGNQWAAVDADHQGSQPKEVQNV